MQEPQKLDENAIESLLLQHLENAGYDYKSGNNAKNTIKIPNVCESLKIDCIDIAEFLRREQARFILENTTQQES